MAKKTSYRVTLIAKDGYRENRKYLHINNRSAAPLLRIVEKIIRNKKRRTAFEYWCIDLVTQTEFGFVITEQLLFSRIN